ncbi:hypothetical protein ACJIZ3_018838 [Penstemon smallii]|uniref:N-acetyltransferase domain-containing protein n=1 Tax=Penstemon smallii TaxID=265156 RepID=A0ABD3T0B9_9LAMI
MSKIAVKGLDFSRTSSYGIQTNQNLHRISSFSWSWIMFMSSKSKPTRKEKEFSQKLHKLSVLGMDTPTYDPNIEFDKLQRKNDQVVIEGDRAGFGRFVAREARLDEEYLLAAWLRAESHWEDSENGRYVDNYKRKFAEQEFNSLKKRCKTQIGEKCTCIVTVKNEDKSMENTILKSIIGTLDLSIRYLSQGETFPGEQIKGPLFCLVDGKSSSRYGYIANLCVAKLSRRQGIASNMLQFAINYAKEYGAEQVFVNVDRHNKSAQIMYQKLGFEVVDEAISQLSADHTYLLCFKLQTIL